MLYKYQQKNFHSLAWKWKYNAFVISGYYSYFTLRLLKKHKNLLFDVGKYFYVYVARGPEREFYKQCADIFLIQYLI